VLLRLLLNGLQEAGMGLAAIYPVTSWVAWVATLACAELCFVKGGRPWS